MEEIVETVDGGGVEGASGVGRTNWLEVSKCSVEAETEEEV